jgi:hypothetical protein
LENAEDEFSLQSFLWEIFVANFKLTKLLIKPICIMGFVWICEIFERKLFGSGGAWYFLRILYFRKCLEKNNGDAWYFLNF